MASVRETIGAGAATSSAVRAPAPPPGAIVGRSVARRDGPEKVVGLARYTDDLSFPGAWHGVTVRSTQAHARLVGIDLDPAFDWSRVVVVTAADIPGENIVSLIADDQPALARDEIQHHAEPVALVAAPDPALARAAREHVRLRTEPLPPVLDALRSDRSFASYEIAKGDLAAGFAAADLVIEGTYRVGHQEQLYIENQAMIAVPRPDGGVALHGSCQCPYYVHKALQRALALDAARVVVIQAETGGGFGGKEEYPSMVAIHAALLALRVGRPVRMIYDRHEDLAATTKRHPAVVTHRTGVTRDGRLVAQDIEVVMDAGAYCTLSPVVLSRGSIHATGPYACPNVRIRARTMATNTPPNGAFRGFGAPQTEFAAEMQLNRIAEALAMSPAELRARWAYVEGDVTATGQTLRESVGARPCLDAALEAADFERVRERHAAERAARAGGGTDGARSAAGIGLAMGWHGAGFTGSGEKHLASVAAVELTDDGRIVVLTDSTEIGQGSRTVLAQLVAEAGSVPPGAGGLLFLPYLAGERSPIWDPLARGAFVGLTLGHGRAHLARAVLEAAAFALRHVAGPIREAGLRLDHLVVTGGTARSDTWNRIKADVVGVPVTVPAVRETAHVGAAVLATVALGRRPDAASAIRAMVRVDHRLEPDPANTAVYDEAFAAYTGLWPAIAPISHRLHEPLVV